MKKLEGTSATKTGGSILQNVSQDTLGRVTLCVPPDIIIKQFNEKVSLLHFAMQNAINENQQLASLRDFLLPMLMNGQVKVGGKGNLPPVAYPKDEVRGEYMVAAEPQKAYDAEGKGV